MIIVTKIETFDTEKNGIDYEEYPIRQFDLETGRLEFPSSVREAEAKITVEMVRGKPFTNPVTGEKMVIGYTEEAQKCIKLPFAVFDEKNKIINNLRYVNEDIRKDSNYLRTKIESIEKELDYICHLSPYGFTEFWLSKKFRLIKKWWNSKKEVL